MSRHRIIVVSDELMVISELDQVIRNHRQ